MSGNMIDMISRLPDEVLCHILSFLPTQQVVATSVLSKRWSPLWISVPTLDYNNEIYLKNGKPSCCFEKFVYATILGRDVHQPITRFRLKYDASGSEHSDADVNAWLKAVIPRGIENLDIDMYRKYRLISLSCCIFRCTTLVALKLTGLSLNVSSVELPSLKSLHLVYVQFTQHQNLIELLSGCPILEDLQAYYIYYVVHKGSLCKGELKSLPKLVMADISITSITDFPLKAICNVEFLKIQQYEYHQLVKVVPQFSNLMHVAVVLNLMSWDLVLELLKNCPKLKVVKLFAWHRDKGFWQDPHIVPECLTSQFRECSFKYCYGTESELRFAKYILQNSTTLQSMTICSRPSLSSQAKHEMLTELALCPRRSTLCQLSFK